jgi:hypothetical protein
MTQARTLAFTAALACCVPFAVAHADIMFSPTNSPSGNEENILFQQKFTGVTSLIGHTNQTDVPITFDEISGAKNGQTDIGTNGVGQADIICTAGCGTFAGGGANGMQLTDIEIHVGSGFGATDFVGNLDFGEGTAQIAVTDQMGATFDYMLGNGQNFFTLTASNAEVITNIQITESAADSNGNFGWNDLKQPRISGVCTLVGTTCTAIDVPEPGSLALLGTALFGLGMIYRRRQSR